MSEAPNSDMQHPDTQPPSTGRGGLADLGLRAASAVVMVSLALGTLWAGGVWFTIFWMLAGLAIHWEWQKLAGGRRLPARIIVGAVALAGAASLASVDAADWALAVLLLGALAVALCAAWGGGDEAESKGALLSKGSWAFVGLLYAGAMVISVCVLRHSLFLGATAMLWLFALVWGTDVMAYFGGRLIGGPKLCRPISPGKTWSGFIVGVICGAMAGVVVVAFSLTPGEASLWPVLLLGLLAGAISQGGDLFESAIKRHYGVKDSGHLIPGHGGAMDRLDGFIFAAVFAAIVGAAHKGAVAAAHGLLVW